MMRQCFCRMEMAWARGIPGHGLGLARDHHHNNKNNNNNTAENTAPLTHRGQIPSAHFLAIFQAPLPDPALVVGVVGDPVTAQQRGLRGPSGGSESISACGSE